MFESSDLRVIKSAVSRRVTTFVGCFIKVIFAGCSKQVSNFLPCLCSKLLDMQTTLGHKRIENLNIITDYCFFCSEKSVACHGALRSTPGLLFSTYWFGCGSHLVDFVQTVLWI